MKNENTCVCCGAPIPEGTQVCPKCRVVTPVRVTPPKKRSISKGTAEAIYQIQYGLFWAWFALACCAGDAITAILLLCVKSLLYKALHEEVGRWDDDV